MSNKSIDAWQILRIQGEFTRAFDELSDLDRPCIAVFGQQELLKMINSIKKAWSLENN